MESLKILNDIFNVDRGEIKQIILIVVSIVIAIQFSDLLNTYWEGVKQGGVWGLVYALFFWFASFLAVIFAIFVFMFTRGIFRIFKRVD